MDSLRIKTANQEARRDWVNNLRSALDDYRQLGTPSGVQSVEDPERKDRNRVSRFFDIVTPFYEVAWGKSFHFSPRRPGERLAQAQQRHQVGIGRLLHLKPGMKVADIGCGVGGPLTTINKTTGASITGLNINSHQVAQSQRRVQKEGISESCGFLNADYMKLALPDEHFDAAYAFEAICHAPDRIHFFQEWFRLIRRGGEIAVVEWCFTDRFDEQNRQHQDIRERIEFGNATPDLPTAHQLVAAIKAAGFEVLSATNQADECDPRTPWYMSLEGRDLSLSSLGRTPVGRIVTAWTSALLEWIRVIPEGVSEAAQFLNGAADSLVEAGKLGIFTPNFLVPARRPD